MLKGFELEFLFVDDGSGDRSIEVLKSHNFSGARIIRLSKNFGSHQAIMAALEVATGNFFTFMSADCQEDVSLYPSLLKPICEGAADMVFGQRENRATGFFSRKASAAYNWLMRAFVFSDFPRSGVDVFLLSQDVMRAVRTIREKNSSIYGILFSIGFRKCFVPYRQLPRVMGSSKWSFGKKVALLTDTIVSFSLWPLRMITLLGLFFSITGTCYGGWVIWNYFQGRISLMGFPTVVSIMTFGFGLVFLMIGTLAEYLWRVFDQVRPRPGYVVAETITL